MLEYNKKQLKDLSNIIRINFVEAKDGVYKDFQGNIYTFKGNLWLHKNYAKSTPDILLELFKGEEPTEILIRSSTPDRIEELGLSNLN